ncbi:hypothetical protein JOD54_000843 [Actinokineospora baliensis]|nr:hypothetical protein [Actinokineospora baliensis]
MFSRSQNGYPTGLIDDMLLLVLEGVTRCATLAMATYQITMVVITRLVLCRTQKSDRVKINLRRGEIEIVPTVQYVCVKITCAERGCDCTLPNENTDDVPLTRPVKLLQPPTFAGRD